MEQDIEKEERMLKAATFETSFESNLDSTFTKLERIQKKIVSDKIGYLEKCLEELEISFSKIIENAQRFS